MWRSATCWTPSYSSPPLPRPCSHPPGCRGRPPWDVLYSFAHFLILNKWGRDFKVIFLCPYFLKNQFCVILLESKEDAENFLLFGFSCVFPSPDLVSSRSMRKMELSLCASSSSSTSLAPPPLEGSSLTLTTPLSGSPCAYIVFSSLGGDKFITTPSCRVGRAAGGPPWNIFDQEKSFLYPFNWYFLITWGIVQNLVFNPNTKKLTFGTSKKHPVCIWAEIRLDYHAIT